MASTFTTNLLLEKHPDGDTAWGPGVRKNWDDIDAKMAILAGRTIAQKLVGALGVGGNLTLESTADATKGLIIALDSMRLDKATFLGQVALDPSTGVNEGAFYIKDVSGTPQLFFRTESDGFVSQITPAGPIAFTDLTDTPGTIPALKFVRGNAGGTQLEFVSVAAGYSLPFGATMDGTGNHAIVHGSPAENDIVTLDERTEITVSLAGTITGLSWNSASADATTVIKILVNSIVVETVTLSGTQGVDATPSTAVVAGDRVAVEYDAGTAPGRSSWGVTIE